MKHKVKKAFKHLTLALLIFIPAITLILGAFFGFFIYREGIQKYHKTVSIINFYDEPIHFTLDNQEYSMQKFDIHVIKVLTRDTFDVEIKNANNDTIETLRFDKLAKDPHLSLKILSDDDGLCFFSGEVTDFYYGNVENAKKKIEHVNILSDSSTKSITRVFPSNGINIYPGKTTTELLPTTITGRVKVRGIYPIECENLNNLDKQKQTIEIYKHYDAQKMRDYYFAEVNRINNLAL